MPPFAESRAFHWCVAGRRYENTDGPGPTVCISTHRHSPPIAWRWRDCVCAIRNERTASCCCNWLVCGSGMISFVACTATPLRSNDARFAAGSDEHRRSHHTASRAARCLVRDRWLVRQLIARRAAVHQRCRHSSEIPVSRHRFAGAGTSNLAVQITFRAGILIGYTRYRPSCDISRLS
jgi:hypothetical protein